MIGRNHASRILFFEASLAGSLHLLSSRRGTKGRRGPLTIAQFLYFSLARNNEEQRPHDERNYDYSLLLLHDELELDC